MVENSTEPETPPALVPIKSHIDNFGLLALWLVLLGSAPPLLDLFANIGPPWPHRSKVAWSTTVILWIVMLATHGLCHGDGQVRQKKRIKKFVWAAIVSFCVFMLLTAFFVVNAPDAANQIAKGFFLKPQWQEILANGKFPDGQPFAAASVDKLLAANEWKAEILYPEWTVKLMNFTLLASWLVFFWSLAGLTSVYLLLQEKKTTGKKKIAPKPA